MKYNSTRGTESGVSAAYAIKTGLASDGGLFMPDHIPTLTEAELMRIGDMSYPERAAYILGKFLTDYTYEELLSDAKAAYAEDKFGKSPAPVTELGEGMSMLELWHGPTCAFKDMALQIMPRLFVRALKKSGEDKCALILVATSGDTGKAALEGYKDVEGTKIAVFYPTDGVSRVQKLQMQTQEGKNVKVLAIRGNFDDAQNGVKRIFSDGAIKKELEEAGVFLSSANSINWGRLVPQIVYYVSAYCDMVSCGKIALGEAIDVCVPTGNFGNIFAAFIAKKMGLPIEKLICASNSNNVLTDFLSDGVYDRNRAFYKTISPSMDILISSNLERLLYTLFGSEKNSQYMKELSEKGKYSLTCEELGEVRKSFIGFFADEEATEKTIKDIYNEKKRLIDTHTAVAVNCAQQYKDAYKAERNILVVSTASAYKFAKDVYFAIAPVKECFADDAQAPERLQALTGTVLPAPLANVLTKDVIHTSVIEKDEMDTATLDFAKA